MSGLAKTRRTERRSSGGGSEVSVNIGRTKKRFEVSTKLARAIMRALKTGDLVVVKRDLVLETRKPVSEDSVSAADAFADLDEKYTRPGAVLQGARGKAGLTQSALAEKLNVAQGNVSAMESGKRPIGKEMAKRLAVILDVDFRIFL